MAAGLGRRLLSRTSLTRPWVCENCRRFTTAQFLHSGHNRWSTIRHDKGKNDTSKSKERLVISKEIVQASKTYGPDPGTNPRLALAIFNAKRIGMPKTSIESAIARGQGISSSGAALESLTIEAILPPSVAVVIECQTDQKARALQDIRYIIKDSGGIVTPTSYLFEKKGRIVFENTAKLNPDDYLEHAIDAGAVDVGTDSNGRLIVYTKHAQTKVVGDKLCDVAGLRLESSEIIWDPNRDTMVTVESEEDAKGLERLVNAIREDPSVQEIYLNST